MTDQLDEQIKQFFTSPSYGVVGASQHREKYGNKVLRVYLQNHKTVYPVNPHEKIIEGVPCISTVADLPDDVKSISIITPPSVTDIIVDQAIIKGIKNIWMQPGAESHSSIKKCLANGINIISGGPCVLVVLHFQEA